MAVVLLNVNGAAWQELENSSIIFIPQETDAAEQKGGRKGRSVKAALTFETIWRAVLRYCNMMTLTYPDMSLVLVVYHSTNSYVILDAEQGDFDSALVTKTMAQAVAADASKVTAELSVLPLALTQALCMINCRRLKGATLSSTAPATAEKRQGRVVVMETGSVQYTMNFAELMSLAFAAQKNDIVIDVFSFGFMKSAVAQHIAELTGGVHQSFLGCAAEHIKAAQPSAAKPLLEVLQHPELTAQAILTFLQYHLVHLPETRGLVLTPAPCSSLSAALCWCHSNTVGLSSVCSCCLTIFCEKFRAPLCPVCRVRFRVNKNVTMATLAAV